MEEVKNSTLAIMDILVTIKEDLAALRKGTQDVMEELTTVREDTKSMSQNTESALQEIATDLAMLQNITTDLEMLNNNTNATLQDITTDLAMLNNNTNATLQDITTDLAMLKQDTNLTLRELVTVKEDTQEVKRELATVKEDTQEVKRELATVKEDTQEVKRELATVKEDTKSTLQDIATDLAMLKQDTNLTLRDIQVELRSSLRQNISVHEVKVDPQVSIQYLPTSCDEIAELNPNSPLGYYWIHSETNFYGIQVLCTSPQTPALSCEHIATHHPYTPSGYYWVESSNGSAVNVYCDMARHCCGSTGGWMRVAYLNMTDTSQQCPEGFRLRSEPKRTCELIDYSSCTSILYPSRNIQYSKVCGRVRAYQYGAVFAFGRYDIGYGTTIDSNYVSGMSITHGESPRKHIWTFAAAFGETHSNNFVCPCTKTDVPYTGRVPPFIGSYYFCDTGSRGRFMSGRFYSEDPLWDGEGCGPTSSCCQFNSPPWFCKELPQPTTDDVEVRVCRHDDYADRRTPFDLIELYIQ